MIAIIVGAIAGALAGLAAEPAVRRLPGRIAEAKTQPAWTRAVRRPPSLQLVGAALGAACGARLGWHGALAPALVLVALVLPVIFIDLEHRVIPNAIVLPGAVCGLAVWAAVDPGRVPQLALAAAAGFALFLALAIVYPAGMGLGDVKLVLMLGAFLGWPVFVAIFAAFCISSLPAIAILVLRGAAGRKLGLPFGPFLAAGGLVGVLWGQSLLELWLHRGG